MPGDRIYAAIDLKSFYASVECIERGLDPMTVNLVVADASRTEKTICLAVSPSLKARGIPGRARLFEVVQRVNECNAARIRQAPGRAFSGSSWDDRALQADPSLAIDYITAPPQMARYIHYSTTIYNVYLKYIAPEDIHVYSIDEVFLDLTPYLRLNQCTPRQLVQKIIQDVLATTHITATAGIGTNLYLCKVAMDIVAKHIPPDRNGVRIAELDELSYRQQLWTHRPLTDFWRLGRGYARKLEANGMYTMGDVARCSLGGPEAYHNEALLYKLFGSKYPYTNNEADGIMFGPDLNYDYEGHLCGSCMTLNGGIRNMMKHTAYGLCHAVRMASLNPARLLGIDDEVGSLEPGKRANLVLIDDMVHIKSVYLDGEHMAQDGELV